MLVWVLGRDTVLVIGYLEDFIRASGLTLALFSLSLSPAFFRPDANAFAAVLFVVGAALRVDC